MTIKIKPLYEKYRPTSFDEVLGQASAVKKIKRIEKSSGLSGRAWLITGKSGQGKSTLARIIAESLTDEFSIDELDAGYLTVSRLQEIEQNWHSYALGSQGGKVFIINEIHALKASVIRQLLVALERLPSHVTVIFTTISDAIKEFDGIDAQPFLSRCLWIKLSQTNIAPEFAQHVFDIATMEDLTDKPLKAFERLATTTKSNMRAMLQAVECGDMLE